MEKKKSKTTLDKIVDKLEKPVGKAIGEIAYEVVKNAKPRE